MIMPVEVDYLMAKGFYDCVAVEVVDLYDFC